MYPVNSFPNPYFPYYPGIINSYPFHHQPGYEAPPQPQPSVNQSPSPADHQYRPYAHGCGHCCYSCGNFRPQFPPSVPTPYMYHQTLPYPASPAAAYSPYIVPPPPPYFPHHPPFAAVAQPQGHCCGCQSHACHAKDNSDAPKVEKDSNVIHHHGYPYPMIWHPHMPVLSAESQSGHGHGQYAPMAVPAKDLNTIEPALRATEDVASPKIKIIPVSMFDQLGHQDKPTDVKELSSCDGAHPAHSDDPQRKVKKEKVDDVKKSKLPPVCLRVDPLPKNSATTKPPAKHDAPVKTAEGKEAPREHLTGDVQRKEPKVVEVRPAAQVAAAVQVAVTRGKPVEKVNEPEPEKTRFLSETNAAVRIQAVYRGYSVRRWQPLQKLKMIKQVNEQMQEVKQWVRDSESNLVDGKERLALSETVMNLLLQLDTIQGLHPYVREARKSVARQLVELQEKVDSLPVKADAVGAQRDETVEERSGHQLAADSGVEEELKVNDQAGGFAQIEASAKQESVDTKGAVESEYEARSTPNVVVAPECENAAAPEMVSDDGDIKLMIAPIEIDCVPTECRDEVTPDIAQDDMPAEDDRDHLSEQPFPDNAMEKMMQDEPSNEEDAGLSYKECVTVEESIDDALAAAAVELDTEKVSSKLNNEQQHLKVILENLVAAGEDDLELISRLNDRLRLLEQKLGVNKRLSGCKVKPVKLKLGTRKPVNHTAKQRRGASVVATTHKGKNNRKMSRPTVHSVDVHSDAAKC